MEKKLIARVLSAMTLFFFGALFLPMILAIFLQDKIGGIVFFTILLLTLIISVELKIYSKSVNKNASVSIKDSIAITVFGWILISILGMLPYYLSRELTLIDAFLESVSGFAGVGGSAAPTVAFFSPSVLLWRSLTNWMGGLGIILLFMAIIPQKGAMFMIKAENQVNANRELPRMRDNAKATLAIYFLMTFFCAALFMFFGADAFSAVNHAMTTVSTGGFSVYDNGLLFYENQYIEITAALFMIMASVSFSLYISSVKNGVKVFFRSTEFKCFLSLIIISTVVIAVDLFLNNDETLLDSIRLSFFHVASLSSTTSFVTSDFDLWPPLSKAIILFLMFVGGCAGSTAGGIKVFRLILLAKMIGVVLRKKLRPYVIIDAKINGKTVPDEIFYSAGRFFFATILVDVCFASFMALNGFDIDDSALVAITTMAAVGPGFGIDGAMSNYSLLTDPVKIAAAIVMILGRLEIFTLLVFFTRDFWRSKW